MIPLRQLTIARLRIPQSEFRFFRSMYENENHRCEIIDLSKYVVGLNEKITQSGLCHHYTHAALRKCLHSFPSKGSSRRKLAEARWSDRNGGRKCNRLWRATNLSHANLSGSACKVASRTLFKSQSVASSPRSTGTALFAQSTCVCF